MNKLLGKIQVVPVLLIAALGLPAHAHFISNSETSERQRLIRHAPDQVQKAAAPLFQFTPFRTDAPGEVPRTSDPLGLNADLSRELFSGPVHNSDLLENFQVMKYDFHQNLELPAGTVSQWALNTNYVRRFFTGNVRAADKSLTRLKGAGYRTWLGRPTTQETSPLTLAGFGYVGEWLKPRPVIWSECEGVDERVTAIVQPKGVARIKKKPVLPPTYCFEI